MRGLKEDVVMSEAKIAAVTGGAGLISSDLFARLLSLGLRVNFARKLFYGDDVGVCLRRRV
jgi:hypothetical protein